MLSRRLFQGIFAFLLFFSALSTAHAADGPGRWPVEKSQAWLKEKEQNIAAYNRGFVSGKSQTIYPWDSWTKKYSSEPPLWFHDILRMGGTPYKQEEVDYIRNVTGAPK